MTRHFWEPYVACASASALSRHYCLNWHVQLILSLLVAHAAAFSHQRCHFKQDDRWVGASLQHRLPSVVYPRRCGMQALRKWGPPAAA
jgi:hypothetical protein